MVYLYVIKSGQSHLLADIKKGYAYIYKKTNRKTFIPETKIKGVTYYGPQSFLFNISIEAFSVVDDFNYQFLKAKTVEKQLELLQYMAAVLYTPHQNRQAFNIEALEQLRTPFLKADAAFLYAMVLSYQGCRYLLEKRYKKVFGGVQRKDVKKKYGFAKVVLQMAGQKFGTHQETKQTRVHTFLEQLNEDLTKK